MRRASLRPRRRRFALVSALVLMFACGADRASEPLLVAAAASLSMALPDLIEAFETETGVRADVTTGASGQLAQQILEGAPVDVFLSADRSWVERLAEEGRIVVGTDAVYARGELVMFQPDEAMFAIGSIADLADERIRRIAIANPESAPYGRAARESLEAAGLWSSLEPKVVIAENVRQTVQYIETGGVDVALTSAALMQEGAGHWIAVPTDMYSPLDQSLAVVADRPRTDDARTFAEFVLGPRGRAILIQHGFLPPEL